MSGVVFGVAIERFLELVGTDEPAMPIRVRQTFIELGAAEAREDRTPEMLLSALRTAARVMLRTMSDGLADVRPLETEDLIDLSDAITTYVDELAAASTEGFTLQLRELAGESDRRRRLLAELLVRGDASERAVMAAANAIGWRRIERVVPILLPPEQTRRAQFHYREDAVVLERESESVLVLREGPHTARAQLAETLHGRAAVVGPTVDWPRVPEAAAANQIDRATHRTGRRRSTGAGRPGLRRGPPGAAGSTWRARCVHHPFRAQILGVLRRQGRDPGTTVGYAQQLATSLGVAHRSRR